MSSTPPTPRRFHSGRAAVVAVGLALCTRASGQEPDGPAEESLTDLSLEALLELEVGTVYGASKQAQRTTEAPSSVSLIAKGDVATFGYRTLAEVLHGVGGFYVTSDRNYEHLGVRGFNPLGDYNGRVLLSIDGHRTNNNVYDSAAIGLEFPLDVDLIERIEIVRGPGSALYGSNAFFGVIDVRTRRGRDIGGIELSAEAASHESYRTRATFGDELAGGLDVVASGTVFTSEGPELSYPEFAGTPSGGTTEGTDFERGFSLYSAIAAESWRLQSAWVSRTKGIPTGSFGTVFDDPSNRTTDDQGFVELSHAGEIGDGWQLDARTSYDYYGYRGSYIYDDTANGGPPDLENRDRGWGDWLGGEVQLSRALLERHRLTVGAGVRHDLHRDQSNQDASAVYLDDHRQGTNFGVFAQDELELAERWHLSAGLRWDRYATFGSTVNPRLALVFNPTPESALKLVHGRAYRAPNAYELYYGDGYSAKANPGLDPETITSSELICERHFEPGWRASASVFRYSIDDLILQVVDPGDGLLVFDNADQVTAHGVELELERRFEGGERARASYAYQRVEDESTGARPPNSPEHVAKLLLESPLFGESARAGLEIDALSERRTLAGSRAEGTVLANLTLRFPDVVPGVSFSIGVKNLLDTEYADPGSGEHLQDRIARNGRTWLAQLTLSR